MEKPLYIFGYDDYRLFLRKWIEAAKAARTSNLSMLAEVAKIHPTFLSHILTGTKDLSLEHAALISKHIGFTKIEQEYFFILIQLDRAGNPLLKDYWSGKKKDLEKEKNRLSQRFGKHQELTTEQKAKFYSSWIYSAVWSATAIEDGQNQKQIAQRFQLANEKAQEVLGFLTQVGLCKEKNGVYKISDLHIHVPNESPFVVKHHTNWRMKAIQKMDVRGDNELYFTSPMSISKSDFAKIRERLNVTVKEIVDIAKDSPAEEVVCLNMDFFNIDLDQ